MREERMQTFVIQLPFLGLKMVQARRPLQESHRIMEDVPYVD